VSGSALVKTTQREQQMRITPTSGLTPDEIERFISEAETFAEADREAKQKVILQNKLDSMLRNTQKSFAKFGGLLSENDQEIAERVFKEADTAAKTDSLDEVNKALNAVERVAAQLTAAMMNPTNETSGREIEDPL
ncbi:MAG: Hsp70 family protein, partial [Pyrinomonadaceae bacterium]